MVGFVFFALAPTLAMLVIFQIVRRASNFAITRPGREMLFTVISREEKYKSKNFIDTVVYRGGDAVSGWAFSGLARGLGLDFAAIAAICVPLAALWAVLAWMLGAHQGKLAEKEREWMP
jgi:AAA family ATP:ADP antiporter